MVPTEPEASHAAEEPDDALELDQETADFIDRFTDAWELMRGKRMPGRVLALLIISDRPQISAKQLGRLLNASDGAISMATRALVTSGYINRVSVPGERSHYFKAEDDVWGNFLSREKVALHRMSEVLRSGMSTERGSNPSTARRLRNGSRYMAWVNQYHQNVLEQWHTYRDQEEDGPPPTHLPPEMQAAVRGSGPADEDSGAEEQT